MLILTNLFILFRGYVKNGWFWRLPPLPSSVAVITAFAYSRSGAPKHILVGSPGTIYFVTMFKRRIIQCPGCQKGFMEGRSMSQHLTRSLDCKLVVQSNACVNDDSKPAITAGPHAPLQGTEDFTSELSTCFPGPEVDPRSDVSLSIDHDDLNDIIPSSPSAAVDPTIDDVVSFPVAFTNSALHEVKLLKLLHDIGAPNYAFQSFMNWGRNCCRDEYNFQPCPQRYESQIRNLTQLVGMDGCRPTKVPVCLEPDSLLLDVVVFPFATMLSSLLNCPILNKLENLVVNPHDRFGRYESSDGVLGEVNSGQWYQDTYDQMINDSKKQFLAPIIFTMDKTVISEQSHLSVYVILFTTSIYNQEV
jgi:hypothetical protein